MTAVTVVNPIEINNPTEEKVVVTATDAYTYTSKKFGVITSAEVTANESTGMTPWAISFSGGVATMIGVGLSSKKVTITLTGSK